MGQKQAYEKKLRARLDEWNSEIDRLKAKAESAEADARLEYHKHIEELRARQEAAGTKLEALENAGEDAWEDLKAGVESAWDDLGQAIRSAATRFK
ncbi:MAG TPA: hypothetical protein VK971_09775 [Thiohalobacter sp.]|nr:hypothetical protein [Thiohalobacter sp.]